MSGSVNCSASGYEADPDIAGIGVVVGFLTTAWLVVFILVVYYLLFYDPTLDPFNDDNDPNKILDRPNPVDMVFYNIRNKILGTVFPENEDGTQHWLLRKLHSRAGRDAFTEVVMNLSDLQIVSGIAILVSGYYSATRGLSGYHWKMMVRVAWFSTITHLAALSCLRSYLYQNPVKRALRLVLIGILAIMVITATMTTADNNFQDELPVLCFLHLPRPKVNIANLDVVFSVLLLAYNILLRVLKLHRTVSEVWTGKIREGFLVVLQPIANVISLVLQSPRLNRKMRFGLYVLFVQPFVASLILTKTYYFMYTSTVAEVYWLLVSAFWGTLRLFELRKLRSQGEDKWTFGQIMPLVLFLAPSLVFLDTVAKSWNEESPAPRSTGIPQDPKLFHPTDTP
ncbi:hypothetical protein OQA88_1458 [Cercophora sp. LCS_1]